MKSNKFFLIASITLLVVQFSCSRQKVSTPDLSKISDTSIWTAHNREASVNEGVVHMDAQDFSGLLLLNESDFSNGKIELDIKGKNDPGKSFVGLAFHGLNDSTYDAIYFRPFNFKNPDRNGHSVQYISHPEKTWFFLRENYPEKYENPISLAPDPDDWFHATILVDYPSVKVFVNNSEEPSLSIDQLSTRKKGWLGFWVGHGSEGFFKNLHVSSQGN